MGLSGTEIIKGDLDGDLTHQMRRDREDDSTKVFVFQRQQSESKRVKRYLYEPDGLGKIEVTRQTVSNCGVIGKITEATFRQMLNEKKENLKNNGDRVGAVIIEGFETTAFPFLSAFQYTFENRRIETRPTQTRHIEQQSDSVIAQSNAATVAAAIVAYSRQLSRHERTNLRPETELSAADRQARNRNLSFGMQPHEVANIEYANLGAWRRSETPQRSTTIASGDYVSYPGAGTAGTDGTGNAGGYSGFDFSGY